MKTKDVSVRKAEHGVKTAKSSPALTGAFRRVGGSIMFTIPKNVVEQFSLVGGLKADFRVEGRSFVIAPRSKPSYTLDELLEGLPEVAAPLSEEDRAWLDAPSVGREFS